MSTTSRQLALALFADYSLKDQGVDKTPADFGFRRNNALIKIVDLSLAGRRLVDVSYFLAAEDAELHKEYRVDLGLFRWLLATTSRNTRHLQKIIREAQKAAIELNEIDSEDPSKDWYGAVPLLGPAFVRDGEFIFELSDRLQHSIKNPATSHFFSLRYVFKSIHSKILFDRLQQYIEEGKTPWLDVQALRVWLECEKKTYDLFKHFRNKVLDPAIAEIYEITKLRIDMLTTNVPGSKRIGQVQFRLTREMHQTKNEHNLEFIILRDLYETLRSEFALTQAEFSEILGNREIFTDERIRQAIEYTRHNHKLGKIKLRAGGYFMKALREGYLIGSIDKEIQSRADSEVAGKADSEKEAQEREARERTATTEKNERLAELGWEAYAQFESSDQAALLLDFCASTTAKPLGRAIGVAPKELREHLSDPRVKSSFGIFVAGRVQAAAKSRKKAQTGASDKSSAA